MVISSIGFMLAAISYAAPVEVRPGSYWDDGSVSYLGGKCETFMQTGNVHWGISREECLEMVASDLRLNRAYRKRMAASDSGSKAALKKSQHAWLAHRNRRCHLEEPIHIVDEAASSCFIEQTEERAAVLENRTLR